MAIDHETAVDLGRRLRATRLELVRSQRTIGTIAGVSQPVVSKIELGGGAGVPLATWDAVARAVGLRLDLTPSSDDRTARWHQLIIEAAHNGRWTASSSRDETLLARADDRVVVHAWDVVTVVGAEIDRLRSSIERERRGGGRVSAIVVIPATGHNRRRVSELRHELRDVFRTRANAWYAALVNPHRPMPAEPGIVWAFPDGKRLRPATLLPGWIWTSVGDGPRFATGRRRRR